MNLLKWLECWWWKRHIPVFLREPKRRIICARCGVTLEEMK